MWCNLLWVEVEFVTDSSLCTDNTVSHRIHMIIYWIMKYNGRTYVPLIEDIYENCGFCEPHSEELLLNWLLERLWTLPTAADQWYWSFNSANVATAEVFHIRLNESATHTHQAHVALAQSHRAFPVSASLSLSFSVSFIWKCSVTHIAYTGLQTTYQTLHLQIAGLTALSCSSVCLSPIQLNLNNLLVSFLSLSFERFSIF